MRSRKGVRGALGATDGIIGIDDSIEDNAPRALVRVDQRKAALAGVTPADIVAALRVALAGDDVTALHDGQAKYGVPVRLTIAPEQQGRLDTLLAMTVRSASGASVPLSELVQVRPALREKTRYHKDLLPVTYVIADMAGRTDSPLYGMFGARGKVAAAECRTAARSPSTSSRSRPIRTAATRSSGTASGR